MDLLSNSTRQAQGFAFQEYATQNILSVLVALLGSAAFVSFLWKSAGEPPSLRDNIPFVTNTFQFLRDNEKFMARVRQILHGRSLAKFYLGPVPFYLLAGAKNIQTIFGRGDKVGSEELFVHRVLPVLYKMPKEHVEKFRVDKSGRGKNPAPGYENMPAKDRMWHRYEEVHTEYLARTKHMMPVIEIFSQNFSERLDKFPMNKTSSFTLIDFCRREVAMSAMTTLLGSSVFELNANFLDAFWEFDDNVFMITLGFPEWMNPGPYRAQKRYLDMIEKYVDAAKNNFDWNGPSGDVPWEPHFGARVCRETAKWFTESGIPDCSIAGALGTLLFAQNSNTIPTTMWMIMEVVKDANILKSVREEVETAYIIDAETGQRKFDLQKLATLPLLQSIFTETLRLRMNFNIIRQVKEPFAVDGYTLKKGSMLQAPMQVAHYEEAVWGSEGHPASEFWAERHIKYVEEIDGFGKRTVRRTFAMAGRPSSYFPFGGGPPVCPGRHFAKHEIMATVGLIVTKFDIEKVEWVNLDGTPSDRPAKSDQKYCGAGAMPPDRDLKVYWKRNA